MKKVLLLALLATLVVAGTAKAGPRDGGFNPPPVVCDRACFDAIFNQGGVAGPVDTSPDNASSVCKDHGGLFKVSYVPGYSFLGDSVIVTIVECIDGTTHNIGGTPKKDFNDPPPPDDPPPDNGGSGDSSSPYDWGAQTGEDCHEYDFYHVCIARSQK